MCHQQGEIWIDEFSHDSRKFASQKRLRPFVAFSVLQFRNFPSILVTPFWCKMLRMRAFDVLNPFERFFSGLMGNYSELIKALMTRSLFTKLWGGSIDGVDLVARWLPLYSSQDSPGVRSISLHFQHQMISNPIFVVYRSNVKLSTIKILQVTDNFFLCFSFLFPPPEEVSSDFLRYIRHIKSLGGTQKGKIRRIIEKLFIISINHKRENSFLLPFSVMTFLLAVSFQPSHGTGCESNKRIACCLVVPAFNDFWARSVETRNPDWGRGSESSVVILVRCWSIFVGICFSMGRMNCASSTLPVEPFYKLFSKLQPNISSSMAPFTNPAPLLRLLLHSFHEISKFSFSNFTSFCGK